MAASDNSRVRRRLTPLQRWPLVRQLQGPDRLGRRDAVRSPRTDEVIARTETADAVVRSICPYCAVGCGQRVYVKDDRVVQIEGDPDSPISRGRLCPKGAASRELVNGAHREHRVRHRRPYASDWEELSLDSAMEMIADRVIATRAATWQTDRADSAGAERRIPLNRTLGITSLGGATLDNEENYLIKKLMTALGVVQVENQARI
jgi:formate dehydrogenase major subunit